MTLHRGLGSIIVEWPDQSVKTALSFFNAKKGAYEALYTHDEARHTLVTLPGFASRIKAAARERLFVRDECVPLPEPDLPAAVDRLEPVWRDLVRNAIRIGGGVVSVPHVFGAVPTMAAILRAYPRDRLLDRGTPLSLVAVRDPASAREVGSALRKLLPDREVGIGSDSDSEDIIVVPYRTLSETMRHLVGIFLGDDLVEADFSDRVEAVSGFRNAARFGILSTPAGGPADLPLAVEGLFGPVSATVSYDDAVKAGIAVPVTVCWIPAPHPKGPLGSGDLRLLEAYAHQENPAFVRLIAEIVRQIPCIVHAGSVALAVRVAEQVPALMSVTRSLTARERRARLSDIASGTVVRAVVTDDALPSVIVPRVVISATCQGANFPGRLFPWKRIENRGERLFVVDFLHDWDVHNGRPGLLKLNDAARAKRYQEFGFSQLQVPGWSALPFV